MLVVQDYCPFDGDYGQIGFLACSDRKTIVLVCDECNRIWLDPQKLDTEHAFFAEPPGYLILELDCSVLAPGAKWATRMQVELCGWSKYIIKEGKALDEDFSSNPT